MSMNRDVLAERGKGLEDAFFAQHDARLTRRLAELDDTTSQREAMAQAAGVGDPAVVERLMNLRLSPASLAAITLVPLVAVAWADGSLDEPERGLLRFNAARGGVDEAHPGYGLFEAWLKTRPEPELFETWKAYMEALPADARSALKPHILERARAVAESAGGFLGFGRKVSAAEQAVLDEVSRSLGAVKDMAPASP